MDITSGIIILKNLPSVIKDKDNDFFFMKSLIWDNNQGEISLYYDRNLGVGKGENRIETITLFVDYKAENIDNEPIKARLFYIPTSHKQFIDSAPICYQISIKGKDPNIIFFNRDPGFPIELYHKNEPSIYLKEFKCGMISSNEVDHSEITDLRLEKLIDKFKTVNDQFEEKIKAYKLR